MIMEFRFAKFYSRACQRVHSVTVAKGGAADAICDKDHEQTNPMRIKNIWRMMSLRITVLRGVGESFLFFPCSHLFLIFVPFVSLDFYSYNGYSTSPPQNDNVLL